MKSDHIGLFGTEEPTEKTSATPDPTSIFPDTDDESGIESKEPFILSEAEPTTMAETVRQSGLAYSAGIALFASVAFMLVIGWGADLLLGTSPWGIVAGIVLGALIGFIQFFRLTSQIFKK
jgi:F0F1-type ATP synthase assembly protein I